MPAFSRSVSFGALAMKVSAVVLPLIVIFITIFKLSTQSTIASYEGEGARTISVDIRGQGAILGNYDTTLWTKETFMQFRGIPYAESPSGQLRFKAPVPRSPWNNTLDATKYGRRCPVITTVSQLSPEELAQDLEDCLNLCVYTKNLAAKKPVMFYIYGGGFYNGSSSDHPPRHLLEKDIVLVVPQYRIGAVGWLSTLTSDMPGNAPIMDIVLALKWVQKYIEQLGGDPDNVTVFGQSAGAVVTGSLLLTPNVTNGLFKRVIMQSGSILGSYAINKGPLAQVKRFCKALDCRACESDEGLQACLSAATVPRILEVTKMLDESFAPIVGDGHGILPLHPSDLLKRFDKNIAVMTGFTKHDGSFVLADYYDAMLAAFKNMSYVSVRQFAGGLMDLIDDKSRLSNNLLTRLLFQPDILNSNEHKQALSAYFDLTNILFMKSPAISLATQLLSKNLENIYLYSFDYAGENTRFGYEFGNAHYPFNGGVHHSNDNIYLFSTHQLNAADTKMAKKMVDLWTSFAINGIPFVKERVPILPMEFENGPYTHIDEEISIGLDVLQEFTATIDDPQNQMLNRDDMEF